MDFLFGIGLEEKYERKACKNIGFELNDPDLANDFISKYTAIDKIANWERMSMSTAQGAATLDEGYFGNCFDGRYIYYNPRVADTFLRFDTTQSFTNSSAWEKIAMSTAQGGSTLDRAYICNYFDGRYIYYCPSHSYTFLRFDTTQSFTNSNAWEKMSVSTAQGASKVVDYVYSGICFDGRYIYYAFWMNRSVGNYFLRFDTTQNFTNSSAWERMNVSTAQGGSIVDIIGAYFGNCFDGRYVYYAVESASNTFLRFDTTQSFTNSNAWERMSASTAQGGSDITSYLGNCFDGRYIYYSPNGSYTFLRFDTTQPFTNSSAWEKMSVSTVINNSLSVEIYTNLSFDGRYIYFSPRDSNIFLRFDTTLSFTNSSSWEKMSVSTVVGVSSIDNAFLGKAGFDGKYIYFGAFNADTFLRVLANPSKIGK